MQIVHIGHGLTELRPPEEIGAKSANLAKMAAVGLPVPPAFVLPIKLCAVTNAKDWHAEQKVRNALKEAVEFLESATGSPSRVTPVSFISGAASGFRRARRPSWPKSPNGDHRSTGATYPCP